MKINVVDAIMGAGKAQPLDSLVFTKDGYKTMKDITIGEQIYGDDGLLHNVVGIYPQGVKKVYEVRFSDESHTECCGEHLWTYQKPQDKLKGIYRTESLNQIMQNQLYKETNRGDKNWQYFIPITKPIRFKNVKLPIDPYVLGVLIGDGCYSSKKQASITLTNSEKNIIEKVSKKLGDEYLLNPINETRKTNTTSYTIVDTTIHSRQQNIKGVHINRLLIEFDNLKLLQKKADKKKIPHIYLYSSIDDRIELLRGLIDTDGEVDNNNIVFSTTSCELAKQVKFLVQSLSGTAKIQNRQTYYTYKGERRKGLPSYRIHIKMPNEIIIFSSIKHKSNYKKGNTYPNRSIRSIKYIGEKECQCILIDSESHLYLTNDLIVTHNTSSAISFMNNSNEDTKFLYITPYLTEVKRIIENCPSKKFRQPETYGSKLKGIKYLFDQGYNIVSTHALFREFDDEIIDLAYTNNYTLIMDEVTEVISTYAISKQDLETILDKYATVGDNGLIKWHDEDYKGKFEEVKRLCGLDCLAIYGGAAMMWLFPISTFKAFRNIYILTYMFEAQTQKYYYDFFGVDYNYLYIKHENDEYSLSEDRVIYKTIDYKNLIHICDVEKLNMIGDREYALSKKWFERNRENKLIKQLKNATSNFFKNYTKTKSNENLWTCFKDYKSLITGKGYAKGFLASNIRATNEYRDRIAVAYLVNKFFNPFIKNFFTQHDVSVDEDAFAVSEMLQFIWRSAIREGKEIWLYIPSSRMRTLLQNWIEEIDNQKENINDER